MNKDTRMLAYSEYALSNRDLFLSSFNTINIYVEDVGKEYIYEEIFDRLFENQLCIFSIFPLGGKEAVKTAFKEKGITNKDGICNVYIVDGDFENIWDEEKIVSPNFIYLTRYNIESYYCSEDVVIRFLRGQLKCTRDRINEIIDFQKWQFDFAEKMGYIFILFALVKKYCPCIENVSKATNFIDNNGNVKNSETENYYNTVSTYINPIEQTITDIRNLILNKFIGEDLDKVLSIICGKIQIECFCRYIKYKCGKNIHRETFYNYLISNFDLNPLGFLKDQVLNLYSNNTQKSSA